MKIDFSDKYEADIVCAHQAGQNMLEDVRAMWGNEALLWGFCRDIRKTKRLFSSLDFYHTIHDKDAAIEVKVNEMVAGRLDYPRLGLLFDASYLNQGAVSFCIVTTVRYAGFQYAHRIVLKKEGDTVHDILVDIANSVRDEAARAHKALEVYRDNRNRAEKKKCCGTTKKKR